MDDLADDEEMMRRRGKNGGGIPISGKFHSLSHAIFQEETALAFRGGRAVLFPKVRDILHG